MICFCFYTAVCWSEVKLCVNSICTQPKQYETGENMLTTATQDKKRSSAAALHNTEQKPQVVQVSLSTND